MCYGNTPAEDRIGKNMKNRTIKVTSLAKDVQVTIHNGRKKITARRFANIDAAMDFVLPRGDSRTECFLNNFPVVLNGWVK